MKRLAPSRIPELVALLRGHYGKATTALVHGDAFQLLGATILSAQTTDKLVNTVTPALFARYPTPAALAAARPEEVQPYVARVNFFRTKAKNLVGMAQALVARHQGEVPRSLEELVALPGVARKTANVVLGTAWGIASGVVVDTHVARLSGLLGLTRETEPVKIERDLMRLVPRADWILFAHMLIHHGREVCVARRPRCGVCLLGRLCPSAFVASGYVATQAQPLETKPRKTRRPAALAAPARAGTRRAGGRDRPARKKTAPGGALKATRTRASR